MKLSNPYIFYLFLSYYKWDINIYYSNVALCDVFKQCPHSSDYLIICYLDFHDNFTVIVLCRDFGFT